MKADAFEARYLDTGVSGCLDMILVMEEREMGGLRGSIYQAELHTE